MRSPAAPYRGRLPTWGRRLGWAFVAAAVVVAPLVLSPFTNLQLSLVAAYAVAVLGLDVVVGRSGQLSLGQAAFFGTGAYTAVAALEAGWPLPVTLLAAAVLPAAVGALVAVPASRLHGHGLAILTLTLPVVAVPLAKRLDGLTGGAPGRSVPPPEVPAGLALDGDQWRYYLAVGGAAVTFLLVRNALSGRHGRALALVRTNESAAAAAGIAVRRYKIGAFIAAAGCGGIAGFLYVTVVGFVSPESLTLSLSIALLVALVVGGTRSLAGPILGAGFYVLVPTLAGTADPARSHLLYGVALLVVLLFVPGGIVSALRVPSVRRRRP